MTSGAPHRFPSHRQIAELQRFWSDPQIIAWLSRPHEVISDFDVADLAGYSTDGSRLYVDRHLAKAAPKIDGKSYQIWLPILVGIDGRNKHAGHEPSEKAAIDMWGYSYPAAHEDVANPNEHEFAKSLGIDWATENKQLAPWIKRTEVERIEKPPLDLDCRPYYEDPDANDLKVLKRLAELGVVDARHQGKKLSHATAKYGRGDPKGEHCGNCEHYFAPGNQCHVVADPMTYRGLGWSRLWTAKTSKEKFHPRHLGAKQAKDGKWYLPDHDRVGKYLRVEHA